MPDFFKCQKSKVPLIWGSRTKYSCTEKKNNQMIFHPRTAFSEKNSHCIIWDIPAEVPFTLNAASFATFHQYKRTHCRNCDFCIKVNSSCNCNWLPPTQGHSLWTSHSPCSRLTLSMPYWTPLENNSSIGNFQGTGFEKTKSMSLVATTHVICHSYEKAIIHRQGWFVIFKVTE